MYYPTLTAKVGAPYGLYVHGNLDIEGAVRAAETITKGMGWHRVHDPVRFVGAPTSGPPGLLGPRRNSRRDPPA